MTFTTFDGVEPQPEDTLEEHNFECVVTSSIVSLETFPDTLCMFCGIAQANHPTPFVYRNRLTEDQMAPEKFHEMKRDLLDALAILQRHRLPDRGEGAMRAMEVQNYFSGVKERVKP